MKTIEERAEEYLESERLTIARMVEAYDLPKEARQTISYRRYHDYVQGATDQHKIDREIVCKWICTNCECSENCDGNSPYTCPTIKSITKALEGEE